MKKAIFVPLVLFLFACATRPTADISAGDAENAIRRLDAGFNSAIARGDVNGMMEMYAEDAVLMPPNTPPMRGRDAVRQYWTAFMGIGRVEGTVTTDDVEQSGELATEVGHYTMTITPTAAGAPPVRDSGKFLVAWRKTDGKWRVYADIFNSDLPVQR